MEFIKTILKNLWLNHRKKLIAFILGALFAAIAALTGIPLGEIQDAAKDAANKPAVEAPIAPVLIPAAAPEKAVEKAK